METGPRRILLTSDTGLFPLEREGKTLKPDTKGTEIWETYGIDDGNRPDLMIVHIGAVKESEFKMDLDKDPKEICYPNHLGIIGSARVITQCRPRLAIISEFGEEMRQFRCDLVRGLENNVVLPVLKSKEPGVVPRVIPGDLPFIYDAEQDAFYCVASKKWVSIDRIEFASEDGGEELRRSVYYFDKENTDKFTLKGKELIRHFKHARQDHTGLYFKGEA